MEPAKRKVKFDASMFQDKLIAQLLSITEKSEPVKASVVRTGDKILVPEGMTLSTAIDQLERQQEFEEQEVQLREPIDCAYWDGCHALSLALKEIYGWVNAEKSSSFFGENPPREYRIETAPGESVSVPFGEFTVPNIEDGKLSTGYEEKNGRIRFTIDATVKRKDTAKVQTIIELTKKMVREQSIYRGKAFRIEFTDNHGEDLKNPEPHFFYAATLTEADLILPTDITEMVQDSIFTPIRQTQKCRENNIPLKRGILLSGTYGTGKTLTANVTAQLAGQHGWTFIYCVKPEELAECLRFARMYQPAVVFCEDADRVTSGKRTASLDTILNTIDGVENKDMEVMVIVTTNHLESIHDAMLRPGRLDAVIQFRAPDAPTAERLVRRYGAELIAAEEDLSAVGEAMTGFIPAVIRECVERAKLSAIRLGSSEKLQLTSAALLVAAHGMQHQLSLIARDKQSVSEHEQLGRAMETVVQRAISTTPRKLNGDARPHAKA